MKQQPQQNQNRHHNLILEDRKNISLSGVTDVDCFDERIIRIFTELGELTIKGKKLHVEGVSLDTGDMKISGDIWSLQYGDRDKTGSMSLFGRLFR